MALREARCGDSTTTCLAVVLQQRSLASHYSVVYVTVFFTGPILFQVVILSPLVLSVGSGSGSS